MNSAPGITQYSFLWSYLLLLPPLLLAHRWHLGITRQTAVAVLRMTCQLYLMGFYLGWLFKQNSPWLNVTWILVMMVVANASALRQRNLSFRKLYWPTLAGNALVFLPVVALFMLLVVRGTGPFSARFLIPIAGMLLGNTMRGNTVALEHFYGELRDRPAEYEMRLLLGATPNEASLPYLYSAIRLSILPHLAVVATIGIVSMPGMLTGQILTGQVPMQAILYQIAIMIGVFSTMFLAAAASIVFSRPIAFDRFGRLKNDLFQKPRP